MRNIALFATALAIALIGMTYLAHAAQTFDPPVKHIHIPSTQPYMGDGVDCIYYPDVMIYIPGTDGPEPGNATIVPDAAKASCSRTPPSTGILMKTDGYYLGEREGLFLVFYQVDSKDFESFEILDVQDGHALYRDGIVRDFTRNQLTHGILHLHYRRGLDLTCSLMSDRDKCWSEALATGQIPRGAFAGPPSLANCAANYFPGGIPDSYWKMRETIPSIVYYDTYLTLSINGHATVQPMGNLKCASQ